MSLPNENGSTVALTPAAGGAALNVLTFTLDRGQTGVWTLEAEIDSDVALAVGSAQVFSFAAPVAPGAAPNTIRYNGTVIESRTHIGRTTVFALGGKGGLRTTLAGLPYAEIRPRLVAEDILRDAGEVGDAAALAKLDALPHLSRWSRPAGTGRAALSRLTERLSALTGKPYGWRMKRDGSVWIGEETWPAYVSTTAPKDPPYYTEEPDARGLGTIALDAPDLDPGTTVQAPEDQGGTPKGNAVLRVTSVRYMVDESGAFRARATVAEPAAGPRGREQDIRRRFVEGALPPLALRVPWFASVVSQDDDGLLGLRLEADAPLLTLSAVPYWPGLPGYTIVVPMGAQCVVAFVGGREDHPIVTGWGPDTAFTMLKLNDGTAGFARVGDLSEGGTLSGMVGSDPVVFTYARPGGLPTVGTSADLSGRIFTGAPKFRG